MTAPQLRVERFLGMVIRVQIRNTSSIFKSLLRRFFADYRRQSIEYPSKGPYLSKAFK